MPSGVIISSPMTSIHAGPRKCRPWDYDAALPSYILQRAAIRIIIINGAMSYAQKYANFKLKLLVGVHLYYDADFI